MTEQHDPNQFNIRLISSLNYMHDVWESLKGSLISKTQGHSAMTKDQVTYGQVGGDLRF